MPPSSSSSSRAEARNGRWRTGLALALIAAVTAVVFANACWNGFAFDDESIVAGNALVQDLRHLPTLLVTDYWAGAPVIVGVRNLYRPLTLASFALDHALGGTGPLVHHVVNVLLHVGVSWAMWGLGRATGLSPAGALGAALLFAVHPIHVEAVAGIVGRAELLMALGLLVAWICHLQAAQDRRRDWLLAALGSLAFAVSVFSKEQGLVLPALVLVADVVWRPPLAEGAGPGRWRTAWLRYAGLAAVLVLYLALRSVAVPPGARADVLHVDNPVFSAPWPVRVATALAVAARYLGLFVWPAHLSADYSYAAIPVTPSLLAPGPLAGLGAWGGLLTLGVLAYRRLHQPALLGVTLTVCAFLPVSNLVVPIGTIMGERLFYLPSAGLCLLLGVAGERVVSGRRMATPAGRRAAAALGVVVLIALGARTIVRNQDWASTDTLFAAAIRVVPGSAKAQTVHAGTLLRQGDRLPEATALLEQAIRLEPGLPRAWELLAEVREHEGAWAEAEAAGERALAASRRTYGPETLAVASLMERLARLHVREAEATGTLGSSPAWARIETLLQHALDIRRRSLGDDDLTVADGLGNLASLYASRGLWDRAESLFRQGLAVRERVLGRGDPRVADSLNTLALVFHRQGRYAEAEPLYRRSIAILEAAPGPHHADLAVRLDNYAALLQAMHRPEEAARMAQRARAIRARGP